LFGKYRFCRFGGPKGGNGSQGIRFAIYARMSQIDRQSEPPADGQNRVVIENVRPQVDCGRFPIKRVAGDIVHVDADVFTDGHDALAAELLYRGRSDSDWRRALMTAQANDCWQGEFDVSEIGDYQYQVAAWIDHFASWRRDLKKRIAANKTLPLICWLARSSYIRRPSWRKVAIVSGFKTGSGEFAAIKRDKNPVRSSIAMNWRHLYRDGPNPLR